MTETCESCRFWERLPKAHQSYGNPRDASTWCGECHRYPPQVDSNPWQVEEEDVGDMWTPRPYWWPVVEAGDLCGEWQARAEKQEEPSYETVHRLRKRVARLKEIIRSRDAVIEDLEEGLRQYEEAEEES